MPEPQRRSSSSSPTHGRRASPTGRKATPPCQRTCGRSTKRRAKKTEAQDSTSPASERMRAGKAVLSAASTKEKRRRSRSRPVDDEEQQPAPRVKPRLPPVPPTPKHRTRPKKSPFDAFEEVEVDPAPEAAQASSAATQSRAPPEADTDEENDPWWQAQAGRWKSWQASGAQSKRQAAVAWWQQQNAASYSSRSAGPGVRCRHCGKLCVHSAALRRHQESSSRCLQAQGWLSWSRTPCPNNCGRLIATGDAWALQQHLQHCPALSRRPPPTGRGT